MVNISGLNQGRLIGKEATQLNGLLGLAQGVVCDPLLWKGQGMERGEAGRPTINVQVQLCLSQDKIKPMKVWSS